MINLTWGELKAAGRHGLSYTAGIVTAAAVTGLITQHDSTDLLAGLNAIADGLESVAKGVGLLMGVVAPMYAAYKAAHSASPQEQLKTVAEMPEVKGIVTTPALAVVTPSNKVVATVAEIPKDLQPVAAKPQDKLVG